MDEFSSLYKYTEAIGKELVESFMKSNVTKNVLTAIIVRYAEVQSLGATTYFDSNTDGLKNLFISRLFEKKTRVEVVRNILQNELTEFKKSLNFINKQVKVTAGRRQTQINDAFFEWLHKCKKYNIPITVEVKNEPQETTIVHFLSVEDNKRTLSCLIRFVNSNQNGFNELVFDRQHLMIYNEIETNHVNKFVFNGVQRQLNGYMNSFDWASIVLSSPPDKVENAEKINQSFCNVTAFLSKSNVRIPADVRDEFQLFLKKVWHNNVIDQKFDIQPFLTLHANDVNNNVNNRILNIAKRNVIDLSCDDDDDDDDDECVAVNKRKRVCKS